MNPVDPFLLEAQREVDAMLPDTPPIASAPARYGLSSLHAASLVGGFYYLPMMRAWVHPDGRVVSLEAALQMGAGIFLKTLRP
jgi:hypothetical protein